MRDFLTVFYDADPAPGTPAEPAAAPEVTLTPTDPPAEPSDPPAEPAAAEPELSLTETAAFDWEAHKEWGETALPEGLTLSGREVTGTVKDALEAAEKRINGLRSLNEKKAPEAYEVPAETIWADEANKEFTTPVLDMFKENGVPQEHATMFMEMLGEFQQATVEMATQANKVSLMDEWNLTGEAFKSKFDEVNAWANENLEPEVFAEYAKRGERGILDVEARMLRTRESPTWKPGGEKTTTPGAMTEDQVKEIMGSDAYKDSTNEGYAEARAKVRAHFVATTPDALEGIGSGGKHDRT